MESVFYGFETLKFNIMITEENKNLDYWKKNAEEDYIPVPISVLRYISELEEAVKNCSIPAVSKSLPDHYAGELNTKRIKAYKMLHEQYNLEEGTVRDIFCKGADWYKEQCQKDNVC